jgi:hypothetical protein
LPVNSPKRAAQYYSVPAIELTELNMRGVVVVGLKENAIASAIRDKGGSAEYRLLDVTSLENMQAE